MFKALNMPIRGNFLNCRQLNKNTSLLFGYFFFYGLRISSAQVILLYQYEVLFSDTLAVSYLGELVIVKRLP